MTRSSFVPLLGTLFLALSPGSFVAAQNGARDGLYVTVTAPVTTESASWIREVVEKARKDGVKPPAAIVFDFNPSEKDALTPTLGGAADLAQFIVSITDIPTIAYVHGKVSGHSVLPALACRELVMSKGATIGDVTSGGASLTALQANAYDLTLKDRWPGRMPVIRKMADPNIALLNGKDKAGGAVIVEKGSIPKDVVVADPTPIGFAPQGKIGLFTAKQAEDLGLVRTRAETISEVAEKFNLNPASLRPDAAVDRPPLAFKYVLQGEINGGKKESLLRTIKDLARQKATTLFLQIECGGGDLNIARDLAVELQKAQKVEEVGDDAIRIIAFIPDKAPDTSTIVAFGCSDIVMSRRKDSPNQTEATIGDFEAYLERGKADTEKLMTTTLAKLIEERYPPLVAQGMVDRTVTILRVRSVKENDRRKLMTAEELEAAKTEWVQEKVVKPAGQLLVLSATDAEQLGVARFVVDGRDLADVVTKYGFEPGKVREATPGALEKFGQFLRIPSVTVLLVLIGFTGLILELKVPGATVPGIVAALSFILLFWAHTQFSGQVAVLAGSIFVLGLVLILLEVFVIPGFGAPGVLGILFMLAGLALATMDHIPQTATGWGQFGFRISQFLFTLIGAFAIAFGFAKYFLPKIPYANRLMLIPPGENVDALTEIKESVAGAAQAYALIGAVGTTVTVLRPAGNVRFGDQFVDVVADGGYIPSGARVKVILVEGNRIVVKEV